MCKQINTATMIKPGTKLPKGARPNRRRLQKSLSTLDGMFDDCETPTSFTHVSLSESSLESLREDTLSEEETLWELARSLRKAKRELLLRSVAESENSVHQFHKIILKITT